jgi:anti-sigma B factor antagonist
MKVLELQQDRGVTVAVLEGEIDHANGHQIRGELETALQAAEPGLVVDLSGVTFIDSAAISALFGLARDAHERGRALALVVPSDSMVQRVIGIVGLPEVAYVAVGLEPAIDRVLGAT